MSIKYSTLRLIAIGAAVQLTACSSLSEIQTLPAKQAVNTGWQNTFAAPSYAYEMVMGVDDYRFESDENNKNVETAMKVMSRLSKNFSFEANGVIDTAAQQYQIIPMYRYNTKNLKVSFALPLVYDGKQKAIYADLSAVDVLLSKPENVGKYSRFDVSRFPIEEKSSKIVNVLKKFNHAYYDSMPVTAFVEMPLTDADKTHKVVRKIQVNTHPNQVFQHMPMLMSDLFELFKTAPNTEVSKDETTVLNADKNPFADKKAFDEMAKMIDPASLQTDIIGFNKAGQIVQNDSVSKIIMRPDPDDKNVLNQTDKLKSFSMTTHTSTRLRDYGTAQLIDAPTAENSVDGIENLRGSVAGKSLADKITPVKEVDEVIEEIIKPSTFSRRASRAAVDATKAAAATRKP